MALEDHVTSTVSTFVNLAGQSMALIPNTRQPQVIVLKTLIYPYYKAVPS